MPPGYLRRACLRRTLQGGVAVSLRIAHGFEQPGVAGAADGQARAIVQNRDSAFLPIGFDARNPVQVDDGGAVDAYEAGRIERLLERRNGLLLEIALAAAVERHVVVLRFHVIQFVDGDDLDPRTILHHDALRKLAWDTRRLRQTGGKAAFPQARLGPAERHLEALRAERLEEVVDGVSVKGPHGVLVPGGHKDDGRTGLDQLQDLETIELRHLDIEEEDVRTGFPDGFDRLEAVGTFGRDLHFRMWTEHFPEEQARQLLVIYDHSS